MRRWIVRLVLVLVVVAAAIGVRAWVLRPQTVTVQTTEVARGTVEETITNTSAGTIKARRRTRLSPEIGGNATAIPFHEGQFAQKGDVLLQLDDRLQRAQLTLAEKELATAEARRNQACVQATRAEQEQQRISKLAHDEIVSTDVADEAKSAAEAARAACTAATSDVARASAAVSLARVQVEKMVVRAPFPGIVAEVSIEVGEWTSPSFPALPVPPIVDLIDPTSIYVSAPMDEVDSARVHEGQRARVTVDSYRGREFPGTVDRVAIFVLDVESQNRTVEIEVVLDDESFAAQLRPGTSADVEVILTTHEDALRVPTSALFETNHVLVVEGDRLAERELELGLRNWNYTEVLSGLQEGETIVTALDRPEIKPGALVAQPDKGPDSSPAR